MIRCKPERNTKQIKTTMILLVLLMIFTAALACYVQAYKWFFEIALIVLATITIAQAYRYSISEYEYEVGNGEFNVIKVVGQKRTVVSSLDLSTELFLIPKSEYDIKVREGNIPYISTRYNFNQNMKCKCSYIYVCEFNNKRISVEFEPNEIFVNAMLDEIDRSKRS